MIFMTMFRRGSLSCPSLDVASGSLLVPPNPCQSPPQYTSKVIIVIKSLTSLVITCHKPGQKLWPTVQISTQHTKITMNWIVAWIQIPICIDILFAYCLSGYFCNLSYLYQWFSKFSYKNNLLQISDGPLFQISDPDYLRQIVVHKFGEKNSHINSFLQCVVPNRFFDLVQIWMSFIDTSSVNQK